MPETKHNNKIDSDIDLLSKTDRAIYETITKDCLGLIYDPDNDMYYNFSEEFKRDKDPQEYHASLVLAYAKGGQLPELLYLANEMHCSLDVVDGNGYSPLMLAARYDYPKVVKWLLSKGVDIDKVNSKGKSAEMIAIERKHEKIVELITNYKKNKIENSQNKPVVESKKIFPNHNSMFADSENKPDTKKNNEEVIRHRNSSCCNIV